MTAISELSIVPLSNAQLLQGAERHPLVDP